MKRHSNIHESQREKFECVHCGKKCVTKQAHKTHWTRNHINFAFKPPIKRTVTISDAQISSSTFVCEYCDRGFQRKDNLIAHMQTHGYLKQKFECKICTKCFAHSSNLRVHMKLHQPKNSAASKKVRYTAIDLA